MSNILEGLDNSPINQIAWDWAKVLFIPFVIVLIIGYTLRFIKVPNKIIKPIAIILYIYIFILSINFIFY